MFYPMRRKRQELPFSECTDILEQGSSGVLALSGDEPYPYAVPISYVYDGKQLYFHCAVSGHKLDVIRQNPKASFCVIAADEVVPQKYTTCFKSVIVFGSISIINDHEKKRAAIEKLAKKYAPFESAQSMAKEIDGSWDAFYMLEMSIDHLTGKEALELTRARSPKEAH